MNDTPLEPLDYSKPIRINEGIYWIGYADTNAGLHCNPYLIVDGDEAVLIDAGSRNDFSTVMMKILQTGVDPNTIQRLIYHHYDPDLCGSIPHFESLIHNNELKILSHRENNIFINYYASTRPKECIEHLGFTFTFRSGRTLKFIRTPYSHSPGSFVTYDTQTKTLFSSDIFGSYDRIWNLYLDLSPQCATCAADRICPIDNMFCPIHGIIDFHKHIMTSKKALSYALEAISTLDISMIAPQHGSVLSQPYVIETVIAHLQKMHSIGIDWFLEEYVHEKK